ADIFLFSTLALFIFIFEQNKKITLDEGIVEYDDLFENRVINLGKITSMSYEKGIFRKFKLKIDNEVFTINFVNYNPEVENFKKKASQKKSKPKKKQIKIETKEEHENKIVADYFKHKRKKQIDEVLKGIRKIELPDELRANNRKEKPVKDFLGVKEIKYKAEKEFPSFNVDEELEDAFDSLKKLDEEDIKKETDVFKKLKRLK
ncbi:hypothetical protein KY321_01410, partial [Candidatus Woesearchaeota archaeon]|nr:hypothetical protein [Candidatus Woesearchaeota archaeon]